MNTRLSAPNTMEFTVYLKNTSQTAFEYAAGSFFFNLRPALLNGGTGTLSILASSLPSNLQPVNPTVTLVNDTLQLRTASNVPPAAGGGFPMNSGDSILVLRLSLSTSAAFLAFDNKPVFWRSPPNGANPSTKITAYINSTFTTITPWCTFIRDLGDWRAVVKPISADWNLLATPFYRDTMDVSVVFPGALSPVYGYDNGYLQKNSIENGAGYWARYTGASNIVIGGHKLPVSAVFLKVGWNLIGGFDSPLPVSSLTTYPAGSVNSNFYGFDGAYITVPVLNPGTAYWVRATQNCLLYPSPKGE